MKQFILLVLFSASLLSVQSQYTFKAIVKDSATNEPLQGVSVVFNDSGKGKITDKDGKIVVGDITNSELQFTFSHTDYKPKSIQISFPLQSADTSSFLEILLQSTEQEMEAVIVSSGRINSRIENLPTKVEVIGAEEMEEENGIKPGNIASILGDIAGIQIQPTSAATGNVDMRVQGLPGKYTQLLRDGLPLFGGYSGSFSILQIPPLDLKQVEIVKGASSTLYGGGAIAGMVNIISKRPRPNDLERSITINQSTLNESNVNAFVSNRTGKFGYTLFTGLNYQRATDVNKDGFSDVPDLKSYFVHPRLFFYPDSVNTIILGFTSNYEDRNGGDMQVVLHDKKDNQHQFFIDNKSFRNTLDGIWEHEINQNERLVIKGTGSLFNRNISSNTFGMKADQLSYYTEASYVKKLPRHDIVAGLNVTGESFHKQQPDSMLINNYTYVTPGVFIQDDWQLAEKWVAEGGLRYDHHNKYGSFVLPRLSLLYKISNAFTTRLGGGMGYKIPTVFSNDIDERDYPFLQPLTGVKAEKSIGANWDVNFKTRLGEADLTINQSFFITQINDPIAVDSSNPTAIVFYNADKPLFTRGTESYVQVHYDELEIYLGYVFTDAKKKYDDLHPYISLSARNKFASVIAYEFSSHFRAGIEAATTGKQYLDDGSTTPSYLFAAAMMRYNIGKFSFVLNCENLFDYRQTRQENIVIPPLTNPAFKQLWAPIDGRVINLSVMVKW